MSVATDRLVGRLEGARPTGDRRWQAKCPAHDDRNPSLSVAGCDSGVVLIHCQAGCKPQDVTAAIGLTMADLMPPRTEGPVEKGGPTKPRDRPRPIARALPPVVPAEQSPAVWRWLTETRRLPAEAAKRAFALAEPDRVAFAYKELTGAVGYFKYRNLAAEKGEFGRAPSGTRSMLFGLEQLNGPAPAVALVEGEMDALSLIGRAEVPVLSLPDGANSVKAEVLQPLRRFDVVYVATDADRAGDEAAQKIAEILGPAKCRRVRFQGFKDANDALKAGWTTAQFREAFALAAPMTAPVLERVPPESSFVSFVSSPGTEWANPDALPDGLPAVPSFDDRLLPDALRPWLADVADRTQCPPEFAAIGAMVALSALVGRGCAIRPKRYDDWTVVPNLWGAVVGPPSSMKSPALTESLRPLKRLVAEAAELHRRQLEGHPAMLAEAKARRTVVEGDMKKAAKTGADMAPLRAAFEAAGDPTEPTERRYIINDATVEKLGELLNENPRGLLHFRDELTGWLATLDRDGHENDRAFFLEAWDGRGKYTYDRIGRGTLHIEAACVSMLGGIQPGPLAQYLRAAMRGGAGDDGLIQRFQLLVYPDAPRTWRNVDRWPDTDARNRALDVFRRLDALTPEALGGEAGDDGLPFLRFDDEAQALYDRWRAELMNRLRAGDEHAAIESHLAKFPSLFPSIALVCHLADATASPGPVSLVSAQRAAAWCDLLEAHARRVYDTVTTETLKAARALLGKIRAGKLGPTFSARDVYRAEWAGLSDREVVEEGLAALEEHGWIRKRPAPGGEGRPRTEYETHPSSRAREAA